MHLPLRIFLLSISSPWQIFLKGLVFSSIVRYPAQTRMRFHGFTQWLVTAFWAVTGFTVVVLCPYYLVSAGSFKEKPWRKTPWPFSYYILYSSQLTSPGGHCQVQLLFWDGPFSAWAIWSSAFACCWFLKVEKSYAFSFHRLEVWLPVAFPFLPVQSGRPCRNCTNLLISLSTGLGYNIKLSRVPFQSVHFKNLPGLLALFHCYLRSSHYW